MNNRQAWNRQIAHFLESVYAQRIAETHQGFTQDVLEGLADWMSERGLCPDSWTPSDLKHWCLFDLPQEAFEESAYFEAVEPVLYQFLFFLLKQDIIHDSAVWMSVLYAVAKPMRQKSKEPHYWSNDKLFFMGCLDQSYLEVNNQRLAAFSHYYLDQISA